jgi:hypothetical protein
MSDRFSQLALSNLLQGDWFPNRVMDTSNFEELWRGENLNWFTSTEIFLREFSGTGMCSMYSEDGFRSPEAVFFIKPEFSFAGFAESSRKMISCFEPSWKDVLSPIGSAFDLTAKLFVDIESNFYIGGFGDYSIKNLLGKGKIDCVGKNVEDFIEYLQNELTEF